MRPSLRESIGGREMKTIEYCARAVIQHLNGNLELFKKYRDMAIKIYEEEKNIVTVGELIPGSTKKKLYEMVS